MWSTFALLSALFATFRRTNDKQLSHKLNHFTIGWTLQILSLPIVLGILLITRGWLNPLGLGFRFWIPTALVWIGFNPLNAYLYINSIKTGELSKVMPLTSFGPALTMLTGYLLLGQVPSVVALIGIIIIALGVYVLNLKGKYLHNPLDVFRKDRSNLLMFLNLLLIACTTVLDKVAISASGPIFYSFISSLGATVALYVTSRIRGVSEVAKIKKNFRTLAITGTLSGASYTTYTLAVNTGPVAYVSAIRSSSILMSALVGLFYFKEPVTKPKIAALILITLGSALLILN